jgi:hypothetical protein
MNSRNDTNSFEFLIRRSSPWTHPELCDAFNSKETQCGAVAESHNTLTSRVLEFP